MNEYKPPLSTSGWMVGFWMLRTMALWPSLSFRLIEWHPFAFGDEPDDFEDVLRDFD